MTTQVTFRSALSNLMTARLMTIPWHHTNSGIEVQREHVWKLEELFSLLTPYDKGSYLVAYDTLGFFTTLLLQFVENVTYHSTKDMYEHALPPKEKWIVDLLHMPPKHPDLFPKFDSIVVPTFCHDTSPAEHMRLLVYLHKLLKPRGSVILSYTHAQSECRYPWASSQELAQLGFRQDTEVIEPLDLRTSYRSHFRVERLEACA